MDWKDVAMAALALVNLFGGFIMNTWKDRMREQSEQITKLAGGLLTLERDVAAHYQRKEDATRMEDRIVTEVRAVRDEMHEMRVGIMQLLQKVAP